MGVAVPVAQVASRWARSSATARRCWRNTWRSSAERVASGNGPNCSHWLGVPSSPGAQAITAAGRASGSGSHGVACDLVEAHKWFNLAAARGHEEAHWCRADISDEMSARDIAEAQRRARQWLAEGHLRAA